MPSRGGGAFGHFDWVSSLNVKRKVSNVPCRLLPQIIALTDNHNAN